MKQDFAIPISVGNARRLKRLLGILPNIEIDSAILRLAEEPSYDPEILKSLPVVPENLQYVIQELLDFDLRAVIGMPKIEWISRPEIWLHPILAAARIHGITDVVFDCSDRKIMGKISHNFGIENVHFHDYMDVLGDNNVIPRSALYIVIGNDDLIAHHPPGIMEFSRTIVVASDKDAKRITLYPKMPMLSSLYSISPEALGTRGFSNLHISNAAFLFNVIMMTGINDIEST
jgi:hypothetical protein